MFKPFLTALLYSILSFLIENKEFFKQSQDEKMERLKNLKLPDPFKAYLESLSEKNFLSDIERVLSHIHQPKKTNISNNELFKTIVVFFTTSFAQRIEVVHEIYALNKTEQKAFMEKLVASKSGVANALKDLLLNYSYQELAAGINELCQKTNDVPYILIQSPREIDLELKKEIREKLTSEIPFSLPVFQINRKLIGGFRIFKGGEVIDHSWISRVLRFTSITAV